MDQVEVRPNRDSVYRTMVLAHQGLGGSQLVALLDRHGSGREDCANEILVIVPALSGPFKQLANDDQDERAAAQADLQRLLSEVERSGRIVSGVVGDPDPRLALEDSLRQFAADEVVVVNACKSEMGHSEEVSTTRALEDVSLPVTVLSVSSA